MSKGRVARLAFNTVFILSLAMFWLTMIVAHVPRQNWPCCKLLNSLAKPEGPQMHPAAHAPTVTRVMPR